MLKFGQKEVTTKDFYGRRQITDIFMIEVKKVVVSDKVYCNNGKDCRYIVGYQVHGPLIPLFSKTPKNIFSHGVSQYDKKFYFFYFHSQVATIVLFSWHKLTLFNSNEYQEQTERKNAKPHLDIEE